MLTLLLTYFSKCVIVIINMQKYCIKCNNIKDLTQFYKKMNFCKNCHKSWRKLHYLENKEKTKATVKTYQAGKGRIEHNKRVRKYAKKYPERVRETQRLAQIQRRKNPSIKLIQLFRSRLRDFLKLKGLTKTVKFSQYIGCNPEELKKHIESKFYGDMSWSNHGIYFHIDHIIPLASAQSEQEIYKLCHYTNLQPLTIEDHKIKTIQDLSYIKNKKG